MENSIVFLIILGIILLVNIVAKYVVRYKEMQFDCRELVLFQKCYLCILALIISIFSLLAASFSEIWMRAVFVVAYFGAIFLLAKTTRAYKFNLVGRAFRFGIVFGFLSVILSILSIFFVSDVMTYMFYAGTLFLGVWCFISASYLFDTMYIVKIEDEKEYDYFTTSISDGILYGYIMVEGSEIRTKMPLTVSSFTKSEAERPKVIVVKKRFRKGCEVEFI